MRSTIDLAHGLGMKVVAEGVEDAATLAVLASMGCDYIQGWHVARPMALDKLSNFFSAEGRLSRARETTHLDRVNQLHPAA